MTLLATRLRTYSALGFYNLAAVAIYKLRVKMGLFPKSTASAQLRGPFFRSPEKPPVEARPSIQWQTHGLAFGYHPFPTSQTPPDWFTDPLSGRRFANPDRIWWQIPDFDAEFGDIKLVWELSRLDWALAMAQRARNGDPSSLDRLNSWLSDWSERNPSFFGPNWKCGQESSIRVMHLAMTALILGQTTGTEPALVDLVAQHLCRISGTVSYARAQNNNHGTSEAAALFIGGSWLLANGREEGKTHARAGRKLLEERVGKLVARDGSFSQYSLTYHRLFLDTMAMCEVWRRELSLPSFSEALKSRVAAATEWLRSFVMSNSGDGPNLGNNDGARLLPLTDTPYRDFRTSCQLSSALFLQRLAFEPGEHDQALKWLGIALPDESLPPPRSKAFLYGGYAILRKGSASVMFRFPRFEFRPGHADAMHVDLWHRGKPILKDSGTFSYNNGLEWLKYFTGIEGHNSIQFDDDEQMPRLGRFLFGDWLGSEVTHTDIDTAEGEPSSFEAVYRSRSGRCHRRRVELAASELVVTDTLSGFNTSAVARWHVPSGEYEVSEARLEARDRSLSIDVEATSPIARFDLVKAYESPHYLEKHEVPALLIRLTAPGTMVTTIRWAE